jgi:hypothetical protein
LGCPETRRTLPELRSRQLLRAHRHLTRDELAALLGCHPVTAVDTFKHEAIPGVWLVHVWHVRQDLAPRSSAA